MYTGNMKENVDVNPVKNVDPNTIEDEGLRQVVITLMNLVETLSAKVMVLTEENQRLRDENNRLKGEQGKPIFKPKKQALILSSEKERHEAKAHHKARKQSQVKIDRTEIVKIDRQLLPDDAQFKGHEEVIVQDVAFLTENIRFRKEKYSSKSQKRTYLAALPTGYHGQFGPKVKAWVLTLYYADGMSEPKILDLLHTVGMHISAGHLSDLLIKNQERFHAERAQIVLAGLASTPWQHLDSTGTTVNGINQHCHLLCNPWYTAYCTLPCKDRMTMLRVLQGGADPAFVVNTLTMELLVQLGVSAKWQEQLPVLFPPNQTLTETHVDTVLAKHLPTHGDNLRKRVKEALAIAAYRTQTIFPVVALLLGDDASQFNGLTIELALCWIHEYRHYKKLMPRFLTHCELLKAFTKDFWEFYRSLQVYRDHPSVQEANALRATFDHLFGQPSGYQALDERKALTLAKKEPLLMVLTHPEILLHNNPAELGARQRVRKRDVSLQARTREGIGAWDTFQTLVNTANKLGVNIYEYFHDRLVHTNIFPSLASLIEERSAAAFPTTSWAGTT